VNNKDFVALIKAILPNTPGYFVKGSMVLAKPLGDILRAIYFEGSSFDRRSFYIWAFFLPLFVPATHISFTLGIRIRLPLGGDRWNVDALNLVADINDALHSQALPFLDKVGSPQDAVLMAKSLETNNPYVQEAIAYCLARTGEVGEATQRLDRLTAMLDTKISWQAEMIRNAQVLKTKLLNTPLDARKQLDAWETETTRNLGLESLR
jgi:hypothetical protein